MLRIYRALWEPALVLARIAAWMESVAGGNLWPAHWRLTDRLGGTPATRDAPGTADAASFGAAHAASPAIWLHAASLGECKGMWAFAQTLRDLPARFVLTANTVAGLDFLESRIAGDTGPDRWRTRIAPLDHPRVVERFVQTFGIRALLLFEVELWPHFMAGVRSAGGPVFWVSARLSARARRRIDWFPGTFRALLRQVDWAQTQTEGEAEILRDYGRANAEAGADLRGLHYVAHASAGLAGNIPWSGRRGAAFVSFHADELPALVPLLASAGNGFPLHVLPRRAGDLPAFRKALEPAGFELHSARPRGDRVLVDSFGRVAETLARCRVAVIGGSFAPHGGHNFWEPVAAGTWMIAGPHHENQEYLASKLRDAGLLRVATQLRDREGLFVPDADPGPECERFVQRERELLFAAAKRVHDVLTKTLLSANR